MYGDPLLQFLPRHNDEALISKFKGRPLARNELQGSGGVRDAESGRRTWMRCRNNPLFQNNSESRGRAFLTGIASRSVPGRRNCEKEERERTVAVRLEEKQKAGEPSSSARACFDNRQGPLAPRWGNGQSNSIRSCCVSWRQTIAGARPLPP